jgi:hypothetical protein
MTAKISDLSGEIYVQFARELGDQIMGGKSAEQIRDMKERNEDMKQFINEECLYNVRHLYLITYLQ